MTRARDLANFADGTIGDVSGNLTGNVTGNINGLTPQASNMQPFNRIINGAMTIDQRNAGAAVTASNAYSVDRFKQEYSGSGVTSLQQSTDAPEGFAYSLKATVTTADASLGASSFYQIIHSIEGYNISDIRLGNSLCKEMSLSFWVKASQTGTYPFQLSNPAGTRCYPISVAINTSNTWEYKTINIPATTSGTFLGGNSNGLMLRMAFEFGANFKGATPNLWGDFSGYLVSFPTTTNNMMATSGATFYITGVQLEAGSTASSFAHENYSDTLQKCQRYFQVVLDGNKTFGIGTMYHSSQVHVIVDLPVEMRATPSTVIATGGGTNFYVLYRLGAAQYLNSFVYEGSSSSEKRLEFYNSTVPAGAAAGVSGMIRGINSGARITADAEL
jgi:hypothetical protein